MKGMNVALIISTFSLASILFPSALKRNSVSYMHSTEGKLNSELCVFLMLDFKITYFCHEQRLPAKEQRPVCY